MPDFGFVGTSYEAPSIYQDAQECINFFAEIDPTKQQGERGIVALYPTPGLTLQTQLANAQVRGLHTMSGDAILIAENLPSLPSLIDITRRTMKVVRLSFIISLIYNVIGLSFAVTGNLQPIIAAILMPASSLSVVLFAWIGTEWAAKQK